MKVLRLRRITSSALLAAAYLSLAVQWLWVFILAIPPLIKNGVFDSLTTSSNEAAITPIQLELTNDSIAVAAGVVVLTIVLIVVTLIALWRIPKVIVANSDEIIQKSTQAIIPVVTHHRKISKKQQRMISRRVRLTIQLSLSGLPFIVCLFLPAIETMTTQMIVMVAAGFAFCSVVGFITAWLVKPGDTQSTSRTQSHASRG